MNNTILYNPFQRLQTGILAVSGTVATILFCFTAYFFKARFDGAIDLHFVDAVEMYEPFIDNIVVIISLSLLLFFAGKIVNRKTRYVDILSVSLIARIPFYFLFTLIIIPRYTEFLVYCRWPKQLSILLLKYQTLKFSY